MLESYAGQISALLASLCFSVGPVFNTLASQRISVGAVNRVRLLVTFCLLALIHWIVLGSPLPGPEFSSQWLMFGISGVFTLVLGDTLLFAAFALIGTRLAMLVATLIPVIGAVLARLFLGESLDWSQIFGIVVTLSGVGFVLLDRNNGAEQNGGIFNYRNGLLLALGAALFHAVGATTAKAGFSSEFPAVSGQMIRLSIALVVMMAAAAARGKLRTTAAQLKTDPLSLRYILVGAVIGPLLGMWLSLEAIQKVPVGVATALTSLPPVWLLPIGYYFFHERIGWQAVAGSLVAVAGVVILLIL
jgi:drug/metabolite transporter (DMT)-like permease